MDRQRISFTLGNRLEELRKSKGLTHVALAKQLEEKYGITVSRDSLMSYEISSEFRAKASKLPNLGMRVEYLYCLADFYGVSFDYLLGKTDIMTPNTKIRDICEITGLSEESIKILANWNNPFGVPSMLDLFLQSDQADSIVEGLVDLCSAYETKRDEEEKISGGTREERVRKCTLDFKKFLEMEKNLGEDFDKVWYVIGVNEQIDLIRSRLTRLWEDFVDTVGMIVFESNEG